MYDVKYALERSVSALEEKARDAYAEGDQSAFDRFYDAKLHIIKAITILNVPRGQYERDRDDAPENLKTNGGYAP